MAVTINAAVQKAGIEAVGAEFNSGLLRIYDGTPPVNAKASLGANDVLASVALHTTAFGTATDGTITANETPLSDSDIAKTSTATFFRILDAASPTDIIQGTVGTEGTDMIVDSVSFVQGGVFTLTSLTLTLPDGI